MDKKFKLWQAFLLGGCGIFTTCLVCTASALMFSLLGFIPTSTPTQSEQISSLPGNTPIIVLSPSPTPSLTYTPIPSPTITHTSIPTNTPTNVPTATKFAFQRLGALSCIPANTQIENALVVHVVDGDTIDVEIDHIRYPVRYIGIDTPEIAFTEETFGSEASIMNSSLVGGKVVTLVKDVSEVDKYGRLLRYVIVDDLFVNYEMVRRGYASAITYPPDVSCAETFRQAEQQARNEHLGLWAISVPTAIPSLTPRVAPPPSNCDPAYPDVCIASPPPDLDCKDIPYRRFRVLPPDPHNFDGNHDGIGCES